MAFRNSSRSRASSATARELLDQGSAQSRPPFQSWLAASSLLALKIKSHKGVPAFDDRKGSYYDAANPFGSVKVTDTNTKIKIVKEPKDGSTITVQVGKSTK